MGLHAALPNISSPDVARSSCLKVANRLDLQPCLDAIRRVMFLLPICCELSRCLLSLVPVNRDCSSGSTFWIDAQQEQH